MLNLIRDAPSPLVDLNISQDHHSFEASAPIETNNEQGFSYLIIVTAGLLPGATSLDIQDDEHSSDDDEQTPLSDDDNDDEQLPDWVPNEIEDLEKAFEKMHPAIKTYLTNIRESISRQSVLGPWIYPPDPLTTLIKHRKISFDCFLHPRVFIWNPEHYLPGTKPTCIKPGCGGAMKGNGWSHDFRPVIDINDRYCWILY